MTNSKYNLYLKETLKLFNIWLFCMFLYSAFRIFLMIYFKEKIGIEANMKDIVMSIYVGFKFDSHAIMLFLALPFLVNFLSFTNRFSYLTKKIRKFFVYLLLFVNLMLFVITVTYITEYNDQFNHFMFEALYDDIGAITSTVFLQYNPILSTFIFAVLLFVSIKIVNKIEDENFTFNLSNQSMLAKTITIFCILVAFVFALRGTIDGKPAIRKWAYVTQDEFLNKIVMNPTRSLIYAYKDFNKLQSNKTNPYISKKETLKDIKNRLFSWSSPLSKKTKGNIIKKPDHIILVIMESYDSWPLQDKYKDLHITDNLRELASKGVHFKNFLPSAHSTMNSLASIISGLPYTGVNISLLKATGGGETTSIFKQMEKLGYDSYFFYGGFLSWQNIGNFVKNQGANHIYSAAHAKGVNKKGTWGIDDEQLFSLVSSKLKNKHKTFSLIMTTSYHGPFTIDVNALGYPYKKVSDYPQKYQKLDDGSIEPKTLGHLWYSDKAIGSFVKNFEKEHKNTLFAFSGDHYGRRSFNAKANLYELSSVPFILYGDILPKNTIKTDVVGSHLDMFPTIFELIADKNTAYQSYGQALQHKENSKLSIGYKKVITKNGIYKIEKGKGLLKWDGKKSVFFDLDKLNKDKKLKDISQKYNDYMGYFWSLNTKK